LSELTNMPVPVKILYVIVVVVFMLTVILYFINTIELWSPSQALTIVRRI